MTTRILAGAALAAALLAGAMSVSAQPVPAQPASAQPAAACGGDRAFRPVAMTLLAEQVESDPSRIWTDWDLWNPNTPRHTTIWQGAVPACGGQVIVSQIVNRQCSSAVECPARVVFRTVSETRVLLDYKQLCTMHGDFALRGDLSELRSCGQSFALQAVRP